MKRILIILLVLFGLTSNAQVIPNTVNLTAYVDQTVSCYGNNDGTIQATAYPNTLLLYTTGLYYGNTYTYTLTNVLTMQTYTSLYTGLFRLLSPGTYNVQAVDAQGNISNVVSGLMITEPDPIQVEWFVEQYPSNVLASDGILTANITGGTTNAQPYLTWWTEGWTGDTINDVLTNNFALTMTGLSQQVYQVSIEDDHGCFYISEFWFLNE